MVSVYLAELGQLARKPASHELGHRVVTRHRASHTVTVTFQEGAQAPGGAGGKAGDRAR
jgi:hypothetical protein